MPSTWIAWLLARFDGGMRERKDTFNSFGQGHSIADFELTDEGKAGQSYLSFSCRQLLLGKNISSLSQATLSLYDSNSHQLYYK